jgi:undecaprenyl diphosphate synthase
MQRPRHRQVISEGRAAAEEHGREQQERQERPLLLGVEAGSDEAPDLGGSDATSKHFPKELEPFLLRQGAGLKVNLLVNYGWDWDLSGLRLGGLRSQAIPRMDLIVRWGGSSRLSGFLPVQSVYADLHVRPELWPDYHPSQFEDALAWFRKQDRTLGG